MVAVRRMRAGRRLALSCNVSPSEEYMRAGTAPGQEDRRTSKTQAGHREIAAQSSAVPVRAMHGVNSPISGAKYNKAASRPLRKTSEQRGDSGFSPSARCKVPSNIPSFWLEEEPASGLERVQVEDTFLRPPCRQSDYLYHLEDVDRRQTFSQNWEQRMGKVEARPPSRLHARVKGEYRLKDTCEGLRLEDVTGPDIDDFSDQELLQTGPINLDYMGDDPDTHKCTSRKSSVGQAPEIDEMRRKLLSTTINSSLALTNIPITLNKRKANAKPKRSSSRPPTSRADESRDTHPINFLAFSREGKAQSKKQPTPLQDAQRTRTTSAMYRKATNVPVLKSSLEPEFLNLFAKADSSNSRY